MIRRRPVFAALVTALSPALLVPSIAYADEGKLAQAQILFDEALALMKDGKYAQACPKLEESDKLDRGMGTEYRLAECYEGAGKTVQAWSLFRSVADQAQRQGKGERAAVAIRRAADLAPRLPMLFIKVPEASILPGLTVQIDGKPIPPADWSHQIPIDPGEHLISAKAPKRIGWAHAFTPLEGKTTTILIPALGDGSAPPPAPPPPIIATAPPLPSAGLAGPRIAALTVGGVGVAGLVLGAAFGLRASAQWSHAKSTCQDSEAGTGCTPAGIADGKDASSSATISTLGFVVGGAALLTSGVLWFRFAPETRSPPTTSFTLAPSFGPGAGGVHLEGSF